MPIHHRISTINKPALADLACRGVAVYLLGEGVIQCARPISWLVATIRDPDIVEWFTYREWIVLGHPLLYLAMALVLWRAAPAIAGWVRAGQTVDRPAWWSFAAFGLSVGGVLLLTAGLINLRLERTLLEAPLGVPDYWRASLKLPGAAILLMAGLGMVVVGLRARKSTPDAVSPREAAELLIRLLALVLVMHLVFAFGALRGEWPGVGQFPIAGPLTAMAVMAAFLWWWGRSFFSKLMLGRAVDASATDRRAAVVAAGTRAALLTVGVILLVLSALVMASGVTKGVLGRGYHVSYVFRADEVSSFSWTVLRMVLGMSLLVLVTSAWWRWRDSIGEPAARAVVLAFWLGVSWVVAYNMFFPPGTYTRWSLDLDPYFALSLLVLTAGLWVAVGWQDLWASAARAHAAAETDAHPGPSLAQEPPILPLLLGRGLALYLLILTAVQAATIAVVWRYGWHGGPRYEDVVEWVELFYPLSYAVFALVLWCVVPRLSRARSQNLALRDLCRFTRGIPGVV